MTLDKALPIGSVTEKAINRSTTANVTLYRAPKGEVSFIFILFYFIYFFYFFLHLSSGVDRYVIRGCVTGGTKKPLEFWPSAPQKHIFHRIWASVS